GTDSFRFRVGSGNDPRSTAEVSLAVRPINDPPVLTVPGAQIVGAGQTLGLTLTAVDPDGDALTLTAPNAPPGATQNPPLTAPNTWRFTWTPTVAQDGAYTINFNVSDNATPARSDTKSVSVRVEAKWANTSGPEGQFGVINALLANGGNIYAATEGGGISRSVDDGRTWNQANVGLGGGLIFRSLAALDTEIFTGGETDTMGVYRSADQGQTWIASGLPNESIRTMASFAGNLYVGTFGDGFRLNGIYRSMDHGRTWAQANQGLPRVPVFSNDDFPIVEAFGAVGTTLFAATSSGVFRSLDQGGNWIAANAGFPESTFGLAFAANGSTAFIGTNYGVFRSSNNGAVWTQTAEPVGSLTTESLLVKNGVLYAGTHGNGVYRSADGGQSWTLVNQGLGELTAKSLAATETALLAGTLGGNLFRSVNQGQSWTPSGAGLRVTYTNAVISNNGVTLASIGGVYRSADNGQSWTPANTGLEGKSIEGFGVNGTTFFAGAVIDENNATSVFRSTDQGRTWMAASNGLPPDNFLQFAVVGNTLYAGAGRPFYGITGAGVYRSSDNGQSWTPINAGLPGNGETSYPAIGSFAVKGATLFAVTARGLFRLNENAVSWTAIASAGFSNDFVPGRIVVSGDSLVVARSSGLFRSADDGLTFVRTGSAGFIQSLVASGDNVYAGGRFGVGIYFSSDQGRTFKPFNNSLTNTDIAALALNGTNLFAGTGGLGVFLLTNNVQSWAEANTGLAEEDKLINAVAVNGATLLAGTLGRGVLRSLDHGQSWTKANAGLPPSPSVQGFAQLGANLYLGAFGQGVFRSADNGASWSAANAGLSNLFVNTLRTQGAALWAGTDGGVFRTADGVNWSSAGLSNQRVLSLGASADGSVLLAGTNGGGLFRSTNNGQTWTPATAGLSNQVILALTVGNDGATLFAGTDGGVFRSTDQGASWNAVNTGLPAGLSVRTFAVSGGKLYAGSFLGVFLTEDGGASWRQINAGLLDIRVGGLALDGDTLLAGTSRRGLFLSAIPNNVCPLNITAQPVSRTIGAGQAATLSVAATGVQPIRYQWYRGASGDFSQPIAGANGSSFTTSALNATANYWALVANSCGSLSSETASILVNAAPIADVAVAQTITPAQPKPGDDLTFTFTLTNSGRDTAFAVNLTAALPAEVTFVSCSATSGGVCGGAGSNRTVTFSALTAGSSATVTLVAKINANAGGATLRSTANVSAATSDANPVNNTDIKTVTVQNITQPRQNSLLRVVAAVGSVGATVAVPIQLDAQGDENALGFSLTFDPTILSNPQVALGSGAPGATLTPNLSQAATGRVGLVLALPSGQQFSAGVRQIAVVTFTIAANTSAATASLGFSDQPIPREVVDVNANVLGATYAGGAVTITRGFEADVAPRPNGNGAITVSDWVLVGNFAAGGLTPEPGSEFQRADCAPRSTFGNGALTVSDWVQAGRYAAGLDPQAPAAGPTAPGAFAPTNLSALLKPTGRPRLLRIGSPMFGAGQTSAVTVELLAQGEENAVSFSLQFDARQWRFVSAMPGEDARKAALSVNTKFASDGHVGFALALPPGQKLEAGMLSLLTVNFVAAENGGLDAPQPAFGDWPAVRELADVKADVLAADWLPAALSLFTIPASDGLATGVAIHVTADGAQRFEPLALFDPAQNRFVA
ncbi:MAG TPA: Ig-like domain-containing protein, partial [Blastocatellia bacterium]|nr:Ig-like domain-containing protein [Blastocatellia bacterium]